MFKYTFEVKDWKTRKFTNIVKVFEKQLSFDEIRNELSLFFDTNLYKWVGLKSEEMIDESGNIIKKFDVNRW